MTTKYSITVVNPNGFCFRAVLETIWKVDAEKYYDIILKKFPPAEGYSLSLWVVEQNEYTLAETLGAPSTAS